MYDVPLPWQYSTTPLRNSFKSVSSLPRCYSALIHTLHVNFFLRYMMMDSSLIHMTESFPADAARRLAWGGGRSRGLGQSAESAVSVQTWPPDVTICPSVWWTRVMRCLHLSSISYIGNKRAMCIYFESPSIITHRFNYSQTESAGLFLCSATFTAFFFYSRHCSP